MKRFYFLTIAFMALSLIIGCKNKKSNIEQPKEDDIEQEDWVITGPRPEPGRELTLKEKSLIDTLKPHSQVMKRDFKNEEYNTKKETKIGKLTFTGYQPSHHMKVEGIEIYHNGSLVNHGTEEGITYWEGDGDVWVIYHDPGEMAKHNFKIHGRLQEKMDFR